MPALVCVRSCPSISALAGRPFRMSTLVFVDPEISTQANEAQSSRVPVSLPEDPCEAIRHAYLVGTDTESEPFEGEAETLESPHTVAPPTCLVEESEGVGTSGTTPMVVRVLPAMSPGLSAGIAKVAAMSNLAFRKRYRGTSELILDTDSEEDEKDNDPAAGDEGLAMRDEGPDMRVESCGLDERVIGTWVWGVEAPRVSVRKDNVYSTFEVDTAITRVVFGLFPISPAPSIVPSPISSPMISLTVPSPIASHVATSIATILVDEDQFIEVGSQLELYRSILQDHTH
nr:hypothetical protein [Tanacetum cinerariifolium]